jgi:hypothetical protein
MLKLEGGQLLPVIFPDFMQHAHIAGSIPAAVMSAGRVHLESGNINASGSSSSLGVSSREEDSQIIQTYFDEQHALQHEHQVCPARWSSPSTQHENWATHFNTSGV